jgi:hypothetical protein
MTAALLALCGLALEAQTPTPSPRGGRCCAESRRSSIPVTPTPAPATGQAGAELEFARLNRTYSQFVAQLQPVVLGPVEVLLQSPQHELQILRHHAWIRPAGEGIHTVRVDLELSGSGTINAVLRMAGLEGKLDDTLTLPRQTLRMDGRIRLERSEVGYEIALVEAPSTVEVQIQSQLAGRLVPVCRQMALVLVTFDCAALETALSRIQVPLPKPGAEFLLPIEEVTAEEAQMLDRYLVEAAGEHARHRCCPRRQ